MTRSPDIAPPSEVRAWLRQMAGELASDEPRPTAPRVPIPTVTRDPHMSPTEIAVDHVGMVAESPIERDLGAAIIHAARVVTVASRCLIRLDDWLLTPQAVAGRYRLDFELADGDRLIAVEADGHAYHERSAEAARADKQRDRWLQAQGYRVLRFAGSEIYADAARCAREVHEAMRSMQEDHR